MKPKHLASTLLITAFFAFPLYLLSHSTGAPHKSSGGEFPNEGSCANAGCHDDGQANQGPGTFSISINGAPAEQFRYTPGETVPVSVRLADPAAARIGFQLTARAGDGCAPGGTLLPGEQQVSVSSDACNVDTVQWATHTIPKTGAEAEFAVEWTAPMSDVGPITLAAAGNGADGRGTPAGDNIYHTQAVIQPADAGSGPAPSISAGGIVLATLVPSVTTGAPNAIASVYGTDFAPEGTFASATELDEAGKVPTTLAETCVEVGSRRAPLFFVSAGQINFQVPDQAGLGPEAVTVIRGCGTANEQRSAAESFAIAAVSPAFFLFDTATQAIAAIHQDQVNRVGPDDLIPGVTTPAAPGESIILYGTGFGATDPPLAAGEIPQSAYPDAQGITRLASTDVRVSFGDMEVAPEDIFYIGGEPCCAGLYQLVVKVPDAAPDGELPVTLTIDGVSSPQGPFVAVQAPAPPSDGYTPLDFWLVADGSINLGGLLEVTACLPVVDLQFPPLVGSVYTVHTSKWQRRDDENGVWADVAGTEREGQLCAYTATEPGQYRGVGEATIDGERGMYSSANFFTKD